LRAAYDRRQFRTFGASRPARARKFRTSGAKRAYKRKAPRLPARPCLFLLVYACILLRPVTARKMISKITAPMKATMI
jgi:hypothetical protein